MPPKRSRTVVVADWAVSLSADPWMRGSPSLTLTDMPVKIAFLGSVLLSCVVGCSSTPEKDSDSEGALASTENIADAGTSSTDPGLTDRGTCLAGDVDFSVPGPYEVPLEDDLIEVTLPNFGTYSIYHPLAMEEDCKHPIVAWGNGWLNL